MPPLPGAAISMVSACRTGIIRCSPALQTMMSSTTVILSAGMRSAVTPTQAMRAPRRMTFQLPTLWSAASMKTRSSPGISRKNSSQPRSSSEKRWISERKLFITA